MIDFHTHILPHMDDGSGSVEESIAMLRAEAALGITDVILTPHYYADENSPTEFLARRARSWENLAPHLTEELPRVHLGAEVQYFEGISAVKDIRSLQIGETQLMLLEMPFCRWTDRMVDDVLALNELPDNRIVLAHIERYLDMQMPGICAELKNCGILIQTNVSYFANWRTRYRAMRMLSRGEIDFLGSDCHNMSYRRPNWDRLPGKAWERVNNGEACKALAERLASNSGDRYMKK